MLAFFTFSPTSNHLHPLQVENCDSNSRLVVNGDDNGTVLEGLTLTIISNDIFILRKVLRTTYIQIQIGYRSTLSVRATI